MAVVTPDRQAISGHTCALCFNLSFKAATYCKPNLSVNYIYIEILFKKNYLYQFREVY